MPLPSADGSTARQRKETRDAAWKRYDLSTDIWLPHKRVRRGEAEASDFEDAEPLPLRDTWDPYEEYTRQYFGEEQDREADEELAEVDRVLARVMERDFGEEGEEDGVRQRTDL